MDATGLLGLLVVIVACDTVAIGALLVLTLRRPTSVDRREYWQALAARSAQLGPQMPTPAGPTVVPPVGAIPRVDDAAQPQLVPAGERDPLADAISAFLSRGDGLFRAGAAGGAVAGGTAAAATDAAAAAETPSDAVPVEAAAAVPAGGRDVPAIGPRSGPEIASPMRPSRYVASGSVPMDRSGPPDEPTGPATPGPTGIPARSSRREGPTCRVRSSRPARPPRWAVPTPTSGRVRWYRRVRRPACRSLWSASMLSRRSWPRPPWWRRSPG